MNLKFWNNLHWHNNGSSASGWHLFFTFNMCQNIMTLIWFISPSHNFCIDSQLPMSLNRKSTFQNSKYFLSLHLMWPDDIICYANRRVSAPSSPSSDFISSSAPTSQWVLVGNNGYPLAKGPFTSILWCQKIYIYICYKKRLSQNPPTSLFTRCLNNFCTIFTNLFWSVSNCTYCSFTVISMDSSIECLYEKIKVTWKYRLKAELQNIPIVSIGGGQRDVLVRSDLISNDFAHPSDLDIHVLVRKKF